MLAIMAGMDHKDSSSEFVIALSLSVARVFALQASNGLDVALLAKLMRTAQRFAQDEAPDRDQALDVGCKLLCSWYWCPYAVCQTFLTVCEESLPLAESSSMRKLDDRAKSTYCQGPFSHPGSGRLWSSQG